MEKNVRTTSLGGMGSTLWPGEVDSSSDGQWSSPTVPTGGIQTPGGTRPGGRQFALPGAKDTVKNLAEAERQFVRSGDGELSEVGRQDVLPKLG